MGGTRVKVGIIGAGALELPHALTHAAILLHAIAHNEAANRPPLVPVCKVLGGATASGALAAFVRNVGAPVSLKELSLVESDLDRATSLIEPEFFWNPEKVTSAVIRRFLQQALEGFPADCSNSINSKGKSHGN
jgi:maleylacetate reductase